MMYINFNFKIKEESEYLIKTTVSNLKTQKKTTYYLKPNNSTIQVGHGMCAGAFDFKDSDEFMVSFDILDASGNLTTWTEKEIYFTKPNKDNSH